MDDDDLGLDPPESLLGQLQRGRGAGFLGALRATHAESIHALKACISRDPRWDHQVESRSEYYAELAAAIHLDVEWLGDRATRSWTSPDNDDDAGWLACPVLSHLAQARVPGAVLPLLDIARTTSPDRLDEIARLLLDEGGRPLSPDLPMILLERLPTHDALTDCMRELTWKDWLHAPPEWIADNPRLLSAVQRVFAERHQRREPTGDLSAEQALASGLPLPALLERFTSADAVLLRRVAEGEEAHARGRAIYVLATLLDPVAPELVERAILDPVLAVKVWGRRSARQLHGAEALAAARRWVILGPDDERAYRAMAVLANTGGAEDLPAIRGLAAAYTDERHMYGMCSAVEALAALGDRTSVPLFRDLFVSAEYSYLRRRCVTALATLDDGFAAGYAVECLWDCEAEAQETACAHVDLAGPQALDRLRQLGDDTYPFGLGVREAAVARLAVMGGSDVERRS